MRDVRLLTRGAAIAALAGLAALSINACSSDGSTTDDGTDQPTGGSDASTPHDGGADGAGHDATPGVDTGTPDTSSPDTSAPDAQGDTEVPDAGADTGTDAATDDAGTDSASDDAAADSASDDAGDQDAGTDTGDQDAGDQDAGDQDAGDQDSGNQDAGVDSGSPVGFTNPVQIDMSGLPLNANTIVTTATGGLVLTPLDGAGNGNDFPTQARATALNASGVGFPNDGFFASNGTTIPDVHLAWNDATNGANSVVVAGTAGTTLQFAVPPAPYDQLQIYATGGNGSSTLSYTITYSTGAPTTATAKVPDWCIPGALPTGEYSLGTVHRVVNGNQIDMSIRCGIYAIDLNPDATRAVTQVSMSATGAANAYFVFYGATAW